MKITLYFLLFLASLIVSYLHLKNKPKSEATKKRMNERVDASHRIKIIKESIHNKHKVSSLLISMLEESHLHDNVEPTLTNEELTQIEKQINLTLPLSYKLFLLYFGDGGSWIYLNSIDSIRNRSWLSDYRKELGEKIELDQIKEIKVDSLLCLMNEDSNGGAWCWLTQEKANDGEWPIAYYSLSDKKLHYKVENFTDWLKILIESKGEVIRELDLEYTLGLG